MAVAALIPVLGPIFASILNLIPDSNARAKAELEFNKLLLEAVAKEGADARAANQVEAAHKSLFIAGWRPFVGWVCGLAVAFEYLIRPAWLWLLAVYWPDVPPPPSLDEALWELVFAMLGIGGLRTFEKIKGVTIAANSGGGKGKK